MKDVRPEIRIVRKIEVIEVEALMGKGIEGDPARLNHSYWTLDGILLAERDGLDPKRNNFGQGWAVVL